LHPEAEKEFYYQRLFQLKFQGPAKM